MYNTSSTHGMPHHHRHKLRSDNEPVQTDDAPPAPKTWGAGRWGAAVVANSVESVVAAVAANSVESVVAAVAANSVESVVFAVAANSVEPTQPTLST
jgi:hypothetical protein